MKRRFFLSIFFTLLFTVSAVAFLHFHYLQEERLRLIDRQIETSASSLVSSDLGKLAYDDVEEIEDHLYDVLGTKRSGKIVMIRNDKGRIIYASRNSEWLPDDISHLTKWQTLQIENHWIRILSVNVPDIHKTVQIGMLLDNELLQWRQLDLRFILFSFLITFIVFIASFILTHIQLKPLRKLSAYLLHLGTNIGSAGSAPAKTELQKSVERSPGFWDSSDEFGELIRATIKMRDLMQENADKFQNWTAQMAHELKTPLTILRNTVEAKNQPNRDSLFISEIEQMDSVISSFLGWAQFRGAPERSYPIEAISVKGVVTQIVDRMEVIYPNRIETLYESEPRIFAYKEHFIQLVTNLLHNALKYSGKNQCVQIKVSQGEISVRDFGAGIPEPVMQRLGQPFNQFSPNNKDATIVRGNGLGLSWVVAIAKKYEWKLAFERLSDGTLVRLQFEEFIEN